MVTSHNGEAYHIGPGAGSTSRWCTSVQDVVQVGSKSHLHSRVWQAYNEITQHDVPFIPRGLCSIPEPLRCEGLVAGPIASVKWSSDPGSITCLETSQGEVRSPSNWGFWQSEVMLDCRHPSAALMGGGLCCGRV